MTKSNIIAALKHIYTLFEQLSALTKEQISLADSQEPEDIDLLSEKSVRGTAIKNEIDRLRRDINIPMQSYTLFAAGIGGEAADIGEKIDALIAEIASDTKILEERIKSYLHMLQSDISRNNASRKGVIGYNSIELLPNDDNYINKIL